MLILRTMSNLALGYEDKVSLSMLVLYEQWLEKMSVVHGESHSDNLDDTYN
jgi:hypothetical protein